jgi:predicted sulfurtransferase
MLRELKVWPVGELVTYGFNAYDAQIENGGTHLSPKEFHKAMELPNTVMIDVRNFNETVIGKFNPPNVPVLDPCMRKSTEFPAWVSKNMKNL